MWCEISNRYWDLLTDVFTDDFNVVFQLGWDWDDRCTFCNSTCAMGKQYMSNLYENFTMVVVCRVIVPFCKLCDNWFTSTEVNFLRSTYTKTSNFISTLVQWPCAMLRPNKNNFLLPVTWSEKRGADGRKKNLFNEKNLFARTKFQHVEETKIQGLMF